MSSVMKSHTVPLHPAWDVCIPFIPCIPLISHLVDIYIIISSVMVSKRSCSRKLSFI